MDGPGLYFLTSAMNSRNRWREHLSICGADLCARGTRIPVTAILDHLACGIPREKILQTWPALNLEHIDAALAYASELAHEQRLLRMQASGSASM
jgi:uncharacterized protein (DUF433 family)